MKIRLLIFALLIFATTLVANNKSVRYKLNVGDEYFYKLSSQTTAESDLSGSEEHVTNQEQWIKFKVLSSSKENYHLSFEFIRIRTQRDNSIFDTQNISFHTSIKEKIARHIIGKKMYLDLSRNGEITNLKIPVELIEQLFKDAAIKGIRYKQYALKLSTVNHDILKSTIESIFHKLPENKKQKWIGVTHDNKTESDTKTTYKRSQTKESTILLEFNSSVIHKDTIREQWGGKDFPINFHAVPIRTIITGNILLDAQSFVPLKGKTTVSSYTKRLIFSLANVNDILETYERKEQTTLSIEKMSRPNLSSTVIIAGETESGAQIDSLKLFIYGHYPDKDLFSHSLKKDANNRFYLKTKLSREMEVAYNCNVRRHLKPKSNFLLESGDSIYFKIASDRSIQFSGKGAFKIRLANKISKLGDSILVDFEPERALETALRNIEKKFTLINQGKDSLSNWAINHLKTGAYFGEYSKLKTYYYKKNKRSVNPQMFATLFSEIDFKSYTSSISFDFREFIRTYIDVKQLILKGYKVHNIAFQTPAYYMLAKTILSGELQYYTLAYYASSGLNKVEKSEYESIYQDFQYSYPGTEYAKSLQEVYLEKGDLSNGSIAPNFILKTLDGKKVSLNDYKGKWVFINFFEINSNRFGFKSRLLAYQEMLKELPSENFELLIAFSQSSEKETVKFLNENKIKGVLLDNHGWKDKNARKYMIDNQATDYLINPKGEIEFSGAAGPIKLFIQDLIDYIKKTTLDKKQEASITKEALIGLLGALFLFVILFWRIYKWRINVVKKREKQAREKIELEMQAVRSQLNPHFLFNSMNSIQHLVNSADIEKANIFLSKFGLLMRKVLNQSELNLISLKDELESIETYLELEALRHQFSFSINTNNDIDLYTIEVPPMLLQPFVENAVIHGVNGYKNGNIIVNIAKEEQKIIIQIIDNGKGLNNQPSGQSNGKGLQITQRRIELMKKNYKNEITFNLKNRSDSETEKKGVIAEITFNIES